MVIDHTSAEYQAIFKRAGVNKHNGAYYYSREIVEHIIPRVKTSRNWLTINTKSRCLDHSVVFIHNNIYPHIYDWLKDYKDLVLVCGIETTCEKVAHLGKAIHLPLSVDVEYVSRFKREKTLETAFVGRPEKQFGFRFPPDVDKLSDIPRDGLLALVAQYKNVYAVGRCAIEAKVLGCEVLPYDKRYPDPSIWQVLDNKDAAAMLQEKLDAIDGS